MLMRPISSHGDRLSTNRTRHLARFFRVENSDSVGGAILGRIGSEHLGLPIKKYMVVVKVLT